MSNMLCYLKKSKEESRIFLHSGFLADDFQSQTFQEDDDHSNQILFFLKNQAGKIAQKHVVHRFLFVNCQTESTPKQQKILFRWLFSWYLEGMLSCHFFKVSIKVLPPFLQKAIPVNTNFSRISSDCCFSASPTWLWYLTCISSSKEVTTSWWTDQGASLGNHGKTIGHQKRTRWNIYPTGSM